MDKPWTEADSAARDRRIARHEAAHAVVALALGRHVEYVTVIDHDPHALHHGRSDGPRWLHDALFVLLAGRLGQGTPDPIDLTDIHARIAASRTRCLGDCDECKVAFYLCCIWGEGRTDEELTLLWAHMRATVLNLLGMREIIKAIDQVAEALQDRPLLLADDLAVMVKASALKAATAIVLGERPERLPRKCGVLP